MTTMEWIGSATANDSVAMWMLSPGRYLLSLRYYTDTDDLRVPAVTVDNRIFVCGGLIAGEARRYRDHLELSGTEAVSTTACCTITCFSISNMARGTRIGSVANSCLWEILILNGIMDTLQRENNWASVSIPYMSVSITLTWRSIIGRAFRCAGLKSNRSSGVALHSPKTWAMQFAVFEKWVTGEHKIPRESSTPRFIPKAHGDLNMMPSLDRDLIHPSTIM